MHETRNWVLFSQIPTFSGHLYSWTFTLFAISGYQVLPFPELIIMFGYSWWWLAVRGRHKWVKGEGGGEHVIHCSLTPLPLSSFWLPEELVINFNHSASRIRLDDVANTSSACAFAIGWGRMLLDEIFHQEELATASWQVGYRENAKSFYKCLAGKSDLIYNCLLILYEFLYWL